MNDNKKFLIDRLQSKTLNSRFENLTVVNCDPATGNKIGHAGALSVVFRATDVTDGQTVAIKFFDPDIRGSGLRYRLNLFERENELLTGLVGIKRALQIRQPVTDLPLQLTVPGGHKVTVNFQYFVTEWLEGEIEKYFLSGSASSKVKKLSIFRECCLAIFALHRHDIAHRDIKPDNLRFANRNGENVGVAIDLGTAAEFSSANIGTFGDYVNPVGARGYAPLEASMGMAGHRQLGYAADYYALGCLLYELFNPNYYYSDLLANMGYASCRSACERHMHTVLRRTSNPDTVLMEWHWIIERTKTQVTVPILERTTSLGSASMLGLLNTLVRELTALDYRERLTDDGRVLRLIDSTARVLSNNAADSMAKARRQRRREIRIEKAKRNEERLQAYLRRKSQGVIDVQ